MTHNCQICDFSLNQSNRKPVNCPYCDFLACRTCCETYVVGESSVKCMNTSCGREWTRQHMNSVFTAAFIKGKLKKRREELLYDIERALLPATQPIVERMVRMEGINQEIYEIKRKIQDLNMHKHVLQSQLYSLNNGTVPAERAEFVRACPDGNCRGFLSTQWKCGLCQQWACPDCHEIKGDSRDVEHTCNPDMVASARLLASDTKPCPNCRTGIFKIDGCDQMWCTQCHTAFNWRTGRIEQVVHNPHYFEWLRRNGNVVPRNPGDVPCQNDIDHRHATRIQNTLRSRHKKHWLVGHCEDYMMRLIRNLIHMRYAILSRFNNPVGRQYRNEALRIQYMRNQITEDYFKTALQRNEKKYDKNREVTNILDVLKTTVTDIILRFEQHIKEAPADGFQIDILEEIDPIVDYSNDCLREISKVYSCKLFTFSNALREN